MTSRLLLDEMYPATVAELLRSRGHDVVAVVSTPELIGLDDRSILDVATVEQRCVVTENVRDFAVLVGQSSHGGVLFLHGQRWPRSRNGIHRLAAALHSAICDGRVTGANDVSWLV